MCNLRFPRGWWAAWALSAGLIPLACAQNAPSTGPAPALIASDEALCAAPPELLDVTVSRLARGVREVRLSADGVLLDQSALSRSESGYVERQVVCDGVTFALLKTELRTEYDAKSLSLNVRAQPQLLTSNELDIGTLVQDGSVKASPAYGVAFAATAAYAWPSWQGSTQAVLDAYAAQGRFSAYAGAYAVWNGEKSSVHPRGRLTYQPAPGWQVSASYHADPFTVAGSLTDSTFWGVGVQGANTTTQLDVLPVALPLDAEVSILIDGVTITTVDAQAGQLLLRNLPLLAGGSQVSVIVTDETGRRILDRVTGGAIGSLPRHGYAVQAQAGMQDDALYAAAAGSYGLSDQWQVLGEAKWNRGQGFGQVLAAYVGADRQFVLGGTYDTELGFSVQGSYAQLLKNVSLGLNTSVPLRAPQQLSVNVNVSAALPRGSVFAQGSYLPTSDRGPWALTAGGYYQLSDTLVLSGSAQAQRVGWRAGVNLSWSVRPNLNLNMQATAAQERSSTASGITTSPLLPSGGVGFDYVPTPGHSFSGKLTAPDWARSNLRYEYQRNLSARAEVTPLSVSAGVSGAVSFTGGEVLLGREVSDRSLLIRTGVPGVPLTINGHPAVTDQRGNALVALEATARLVSVSLYGDDLPLNVTVKNDVARLNVRGNGLITLDWRENFEVSRWVQLFWKPGEVAANADLHLGGQSLPADPDGNVLLPQNVSTLSGILQTQDGTRQCTLTLTSASTATCAGNP